VPVQPHSHLHRRGPAPLLRTPRCSPLRPSRRPPCHHGLMRPLQVAPLHTNATSPRILRTSPPNHHPSRNLQLPAVELQLLPYLQRICNRILYQPPDPLCSPKKYSYGTIRHALLTSIGEPRNLSGALKDTHWKLAMQDKYDGLIANLVTPSSHRNVIYCK
jgi:hypothetical protein